MHSGQSSCLPDSGMGVVCGPLWHRVCSPLQPKRGPEGLPWMPVQVLLEPREGLMGAVVDVVITEATRWSVKGQITAWILPAQAQQQPPSSQPPAVPRADGTATLLPDSSLVNSSLVTATVAAAAGSRSVARQPDAVSLSGSQSGTTAVEVSLTDTGAEHSSGMAPGGRQPGQSVCTNRDGLPDDVSAVIGQASPAAMWSEPSAESAPSSAHPLAAPHALESSPAVGLAEMPHHRNDASSTAASTTRDATVAETGSLLAADSRDGAADSRDGATDLTHSTDGQCTVSSHKSLSHDLPSIPADINKVPGVRQPSLTALDCALYVGVLIGLMGVFSNALWVLLMDVP